MKLLFKLEAWIFVQFIFLWHELDSGTFLFTRIISYFTQYDYLPRIYIDTPCDKADFRKSVVNSSRIVRFVSEFQGIRVILSVIYSESYGLIGVNAAMI